MLPAYSLMHWWGIATADQKWLLQLLMLRPSSKSSAYRMANIYFFISVSRVHPILGASKKGQEEEDGGNLLSPWLGGHM
jgi:hypothetical protein